MASRTGTPTPGGGAASSGRNSAWGIPDHLSHLVGFLPSSVPEMLQITQPTTKGAAAAAAAAATAAAAAAAAASSNSATTSATTAAPPPPPSSRPSPHAFTTLELTEPPTRVRWPSKRATMTEMRKRIRNISDFVSRQQVDAAERSVRNEALGIGVGGAATTVGGNRGVGVRGGEQDVGQGEQGEQIAQEQSGQSTRGEQEQSGQSTRREQEQSGQSTPTAPSSSSSTTTTTTQPPLTESIRLMEEISREVIDWCNRFGPNAQAQAAAKADAAAAAATAASAAPAASDVDPVQAAS